MGSTVAWISSLFTTSAPSPICLSADGNLLNVYSHQTIKKDEFYALLCAADLGVITPLRDGMNTTSMEFVIAQSNTKKSPLILSEFMGISSNMTEALQINPWNLDVRLFVSTFSHPFVDTLFSHRTWQR
jgi:Glycosyltransferase family 20